MNAVLTPWDNVCPTITAPARTIPIASSFSNTNTIPFSCKTSGQKEEKRNTSARRHKGVSMWTQWMKHADILQGRQKECPSEQWQRRAGHRRRGWPWQITNKKMDKTSLARQKPPWKSTVSRKNPETQYSYFIGLLVLLSSSSNCLHNAIIKSEMIWQRLKREERSP